MFFYFSFKEEDAFVGYHKETAATVVVQASNQLRKCVNKLSRTPYLWEVALDQGLLHMVSRDELKHVKKDSERWKNAVSYTYIVDIVKNLHAQLVE